MMFSHDSFFSAHHFLKVVPKIHTSTAVISLSTREIKISCPKPSDKKREIRETRERQEKDKKRDKRERERDK